MDEKKEKSKFDKVLNAKDVFVIAFGAMIGWGWIVMAGDWIGYGGSIGAMLAFGIGGLMVTFVGFIYAELTSAMPECGGEHVFSLRALGRTGSFICTWAIIFGYVGVVAFEACALPTVLKYLVPSIVSKGYLYTIGGFDVYASWLAIAIVTAIIITIINYFGAKTAAIAQTVLTAIIALVGICIIVSAVFTGHISNMHPLFSSSNPFGGILKVAVMTPFMLVGFDVIPQAAEEINVPFKKIGKIMLFSILMAIVWYVLIILAVSLILNHSELKLTDLATADAMKKALFNSNAASYVCIIGGIMGIITSWNSFFIGGSRAIYSLAASNMIPNSLAKLQPKYKTPVNAVALVGLAAVIAPFFGKSMLTWITDAGSFGVCLAYFLVSVSFCVLRKKEPEMKRPYKVKHGGFIGAMGVLCTFIMCLLYVLPCFSSALVMQEWVITLTWTGLGIIFYFVAKAKYGVKFGVHSSIQYEDIVE